MLSAPGENAISYHFSRRLGLFIHWGIYAVPAWQEQHQLRLKVPRAEYAELAGKFNPDAFDPDAWIDLAESAAHRAHEIDGEAKNSHCDPGLVEDSASENE